MLSVWTGVTRMARPGRFPPKVPFAKPLMAAGVFSVAAFLAVTPTDMSRAPAGQLRFDFARADTGWVSEFQTLASLARGQELANASATVHGGDIGDVAETTDPVAVAPVIASAAPVAGTASAHLDGPIDRTITGSVKPSRRPLLPPVPGPDAFKVGKGDRLPPIPSIQPMPSKPEAQRDDAGTPSPHADLSLDQMSHRRPGPRTYSTRVDDVAQVAPPAVAPTLAYSGQSQTEPVEEPFQALFATPGTPGPAAGAIDAKTKPAPTRAWAYAALPKSVKDDRQQECLANAIYFGARDEGTRAQQAVAQVMLNRVLSPDYPNNICGVVYQRADRSHCQFDFMCVHKRRVVRDEEAWSRAIAVARDATNGRFYLDEIADSTHFRRGSDKSGWASEMKRVGRIGSLTFYRGLKG